MLLKAAPMMTPTARSMTLPRAMNSRNSETMLIAGDPLFVARVQPLAQFLAALEEGHVLGAHFDGLAGARVTARTGVARAHGQGPEAAQLDPTARFQGLDHPLQDHAHHPLDVALGEVRILFGETGDQLGLDHTGTFPIERRDHGQLARRFQGMKTANGTLRLSSGSACAK